VTGLRTWWDGVEEWLIRLPFVPQLLVTLVVVVPLAIVAAMVLSQVVEVVTGVAAWLGSAVSSVWKSQVIARFPARPGTSEPGPVAASPVGAPSAESAP